MEGNTVTADKGAFDFNWILQRATNILKDPKSTWNTIQGESDQMLDVLKKYVLLLALVPTLAAILSNLIFGSNAMMPFSFAATLMQYVLMVAMTFVSAALLSWISGFFEGNKSMNRGYQLVAYAGTASWVGGVFILVPMLGWLISFALSLYGIYIFYVGITPTLQVPEGKKIPFLIVSVISIAVVYMVLFGLLIGSMVASAVSSGALNGMGG